ncbi:hypothetical protein AB0L74_05775, partial [Streptomyces sp. NPDC052020]|uniref:hypothetical protein n=1 Tax=Streptomyces sp. NPDC052020 TaxID=3155677 RepID=UPI00342A2424
MARVTGVRGLSGECRVPGLDRRCRVRRRRGLRALGRGLARRCRVRRRRGLRALGRGLARRCRVRRRRRLRA